MAVGSLLDPTSPGWGQALQDLRHDAYHLPAYARVHADLTGGHALAFSYVDGARRFLLPLVLHALDGGGWDAASPYGYPGPLSSTPDEHFWCAALSALVTTLEQHGVVTLFVRLHPLLSAQSRPLERFGTLVRHGDTVSVDLRQDPGDVVAGFRSNHRRQIERARRSGAVVEVDRWELLDPFVDAYYETMTRVGAAPDYFFPRGYFRQLASELPGAVHLITALRGEALLAGGLFFTCQDLVQYHLGATWTHALPEQPMKLVFDETWRWAQQRGATDLHLGGGVGGAADSLFHFKAGFSPRRHSFQTLRVVVDPVAYRRLCAAAGVRPEHDLTGYFPSFRGPGPEARPQPDDLGLTLPSGRP